MPIDYQQSVIYKLESHVSPLFYIGGTARPDARWGEHLTDAPRYPHRTVYAHMLETGIENWRMTVIQNFPCANKDELRAREQHWKEELGATLNMNEAMLTPADRLMYLQRRADIIAEQKHAWYLANIEKVAEHNRQYKQRYIPANKQFLAAAGRAYYANNKEKFAAYNRRTYTCECGVVSTIKHKMRHVQSQKHIRWINAQRIQMPVIEQLAI